MKKRELLEKALGNIFEEKINKGELAGASICFLHEDQRIFYKGYGYADIENKTPIQSDTIFRLYSMSKPIAAVAAYILVERGQLDLYTPISAYLPEFSHMKVYTNEGLVEAKNEIMVRDLLNMTSGIVYPGDDGAGLAMQELFDKVQVDIDAGREISTRELIRQVAKQPLAFEPGTQWRYGFSTDVIGAIIEAVSGMRLGEFYQKELFDKLDMKDTGFFVPEDKVDRFAKLYTWSNDDKLPKLKEEFSRHLCLTNSLKQPRFESAGAGIVSTMDDYAHFAQMLMQNGSYKGNCILGRKTIELLGQNLLSKEQMECIGDEQMKGYGYGNFMRIYLDMGQAGCSGSVGEFGWDGWTGTYFTANPKEKFSIIMMLQRSEYVSPALMRKVRNIGYALLDA